MAVTISNEELDIFNKNGFTDDDVQATVNKYRSEGLDDNAIRAKVQERLNGWGYSQPTSKATIPKPTNPVAPKAPEPTTNINNPTPQPTTNVPKSNWLDNATTTIKSKVADFNKQLDDSKQKMNEEVKTRAKENLRKRAEWEQKHPFISGIQKDYQLPTVFTGNKSYRGQVPQWELEAKYGLDIPVKEQIKGAAKTTGLNLVAPVNIGVEYATGGKGKIVKEGLKAAVKQGAKQLAKTGGIGATVQGITSSLADNGISKDLLVRPLQYGALGVLGGGAVGGLTPILAKGGSNAVKVAGKAKDKVVDAIASTDVGAKALQTAENAKTAVKNTIDPAIKKAERTFKQYINAKKAKAEATKPQEIIENMPEASGRPVEVETGINTPETNLTHVNEAPTSSNIVGSRTKESALAKNAKKSDEVADAIKENPTTYEAITNAETTAQAQKEIAENADRVHSDIIKKLSDEKTDATALDVEKARQLFTELQKQGRFEEATDLLELTSKEGSKLGQAVQAFSLWSKTTPEGAQLYAQKLLDKYNNGVRKDLQKRLSQKQLNEIGQVFKELNESGLTGRELEVATAKAMKKVYKVVPKTFSQKLDGYRYINMLLSGKSRFKDFILTGKNALDTSIDETIAGGIDAIRSAVTKDKTRYVSANPFTGTKAWAKGFWKGIKEGVEDVKHGINTSRSGEVGKYGLPNDTIFEYKPLKELKDEVKDLSKFGKTKAYIDQSISNILHKPERALRYTLQVPDRAFFEARYASSLANQMKARGVTEPTQDMINSAIKEAKKAVFQEDRAITLASMKAANLVDEVTVRNAEKMFGLPKNTLPSVSKSVSPFMKTPTNVIAQGAEGLHGSASGFAKLMNAVREGNPEAIRQAELLMGRGIRGLGELGLGVAVGKGAWDSIKHNFGDDYTENEVTGLKPNSVIIGDKAFSMQNMQTNLPFFAGVGLGEDGVGQAWTNTKNVVSELPGVKLMSEINNAVNEVNNAAESGSTKSKKFKKQLRKGGKALRNLTASYVTSLLPVSSQLGESRNWIDPTAREVADPNPIKYIQNRVKNKIPFKSKELPTKYNKIGEEVKVNNIENPIARAASEAIDFGVRNYKKPPRALEVAEYVARETGNEALLPPRITSRVTFKQGNENITKELNAQELSDYKRRVAQLTFKYRPKSLKPLAKMTKDEFEEYASRIRQADSLAKQIVEHDMFKGNYPEAVKVSKKGNIRWMGNEKMLDLNYLQGEYNKIKQQEEKQAAKEKRIRLEKRARGK